MTPISITSTYIDDILIIRKAKRISSNMRQEYRTAYERRIRRDEYIEFLEKSKYAVDVFQRMLEKIQQAIDDKAPETDKVLQQGHF